MYNAYDYLFEKFDSISKWVEDSSLPVCVFGAGRYGSGSGYLLISELLGFRVECFCDNDPNKWGHSIVGNIPCISPGELINSQPSYLCFLAVGANMQNEIIEQLMEAGIHQIIPFAYPCSEIVIAHILRKQFYAFRYSVNPKKVIDELNQINTKNQRNTIDGKVVVYTCVSNDYDKVLEPLWQSNNVDWVVISDNPLENNSAFQWWDINEIVPKNIKDPSLQNRYCKINAHLLFSDYKASIYVDGNVQIVGDVLSFLEYVGESGIATHNHPVRNCLYDEGIICTVYKKADKKDVKSQLESYHKQGMPSGYGLFELNVLVRFHNKPECIRIMETWWNEVAYKTHRDQLSFTYALWRNGFSTDGVGVLGANVKNNKLLRVFGHRTGAGEARARGLIQSRNYFINPKKIFNGIPKDILDLLIVVIRTVGEQTTQACFDILRLVLPSVPIYLVNEVPFENAIKKTFQIGMESGKKWSIVIDADVLIDKNGLLCLINDLGHIPESVFAIQGLVFDKFFNVYRPAGNHIYRNSFLNEAMKKIANPGENLRPETAVIDNMISEGFDMLQCSTLIGIHDYGQSYLDIAKKAFLQSHKHVALHKSLFQLWTSKANVDLDFYAALLGWDIGIKYREKVYVDSEFISEKVKNVIDSDSKLSLDQRDPLEWTLEDVESIMNVASTSINHALQAEYFSRALWDRIYYKNE